MRRTGKIFFRCTLLLALIGFFSLSSLAQSNLDVSASVSETTIYTGERVEFSISVSGSFNNVSRPELPEFEGFRLLSNNPSTSRQFSMVNGETSTSYSYTYYLIAQEKGDYQIPPADINIDGSDYQTNPISVSIVDRNESATNPGSESRPDIFLRLDASDNNPVTGQQLVIGVNLFFKDGLEVNSYQPVPGWKAEGFWKEELENTDRPRAESTIIDGVRYRKARLLQFALFPTKAGELTISPYEIIVSVRSSSSSDRLSSFFGGFGSNQRQVELRSDPVTVNVENLPAISGATYVGAVGSFDIDRSISSRDVLVGESIEIETTIRGSGNVPLISKPEYDLPDGLEIYEPQESSSINRRNQQITGLKTYTDVIIARNPGSYTIPEAELAYFNPESDQYETKTMPAISFSVARDPDANVTTNQNLSLDIKPITGLASWVTPASSELITHWWFWVGLIIPMIVVGAGYWRKSYIERMQTDTAFARSRFADNIANERLQEAIELSEDGNIKGAYNALQKALTGFIGDRINLPEAGLSINEYADALEQKNVDPNLVKNVRMLLDKCATISYAPDTSHAYLKSHVALAQSILDKLKKEL